MKKSNIQSLKKAAASLLLASIAFAATAQKLPTIQKTGVAAPATIKVDGKAAEWDDTFQAYNKNTNTYYTMANDADNLYLAIQATDPNDINKITAGGITFTIKSTDKKSTATPVAIIYPLKTKVVRPAGGPMPAAIRVGMGPGGGGGGGAVRTLSPMAKLRSDQPLTDSDLMALNKQINTNVKEIRVIGLKEFPDSTVSLYNEDGIHAAGLINLKKAYTIEFSIALKYLQPLINSVGTFNYNVQVNGLIMNIIQISDVPVGGGGGGGGATMKMDIAGPGGGGMPASFQSMTSPTDFSGTYTLVKNK
jgi:hypothetical protein